MHCYMPRVRCGEGRFALLCLCMCVGGGGANTARVALKPAQRGAPRQGHPQAPPPQPGRRGLRPETSVSQWRTRNLNGRTRCRVRRNPRLHTPPGRGIPLPRHCGTSKGYPAVSVSPCHTRAAGQCLMRPLKKGVLIWLLTCMSQVNPARPAPASPGFVARLWPGCQTALTGLPFPRWRTSVIPLKVVSLQ